MKKKNGNTSVASTTKYECEELNRLLFEESTDGILIAGVETKTFKYANPAICKMLGYSKEQFSKLGLADIHPKDDLQRVIGEFESKVHGDKSLASNIPCLRKDGSIVYVDISASGIITIDRIPCIMGIFRDITERRLNEELLKRDHQLLRTVIDNSPDLIYSKDLASRKTFANLVDVRYMGAKSETEVLGKDDFEFYPKEIASKFLADDQRIMQTGQPIINREELLIDSEGKTHWLLTSKLPLKDKSGNITGLVGNGRDITEHKRAEVSVHNEQKLLRTIIDLIPDAIYVKDKEGRKIVVNSKEIELCGRNSEDEIIGKTDSDLISAYEAKRSNIEDQIVLKTGKPLLDIEGEIIDKKECHHWLLGSKVPLRDAQGQIIGIVGLNHDITERKKMEEELQILSSRQSAILASVPDIIMEVDNNKVYKWANAAGVKFFGDDVVGKDASFYFEGEQDTYVNVEPLFQGDESTIYIESWQRRRDGERRLLAWWCKVLKDRNGEVTGALSTARDITERKRAEKALNDSRENLYLLLNSMAEGAYGVDNNGNCTFVNRAFLQILGYESENELIGKDIHELIHHSYNDGSPYPANECRMYHVLITKKAITVSDEVFWRRDGVPIPIEYWVHPIVKEGKVIGLIATFIDITERKNFDLIRNAVFKISLAADKIMSLDELYKSIHEIISTIMHAKNFYISMYDERINTISFPYSVDEKDVFRSTRSFGNGLTEYVLRKGEALLVNNEQILEMCNKGEIVQSGTPSAIWLGVPLTIDDKAIGVMAVQHYSDSKAYGERELRMLEYISSQVARTIERKRAEEKIKILSSAVENAYESFVLTDINGNISYANEFAYKIFGFSPNELLEMKLTRLSSNNEEVEKILSEVVSTENYNGDIILTKKNNEAFPAALNVSLIKDASGVPSGMMCIIRDISERHLAEQEIISQKEKFLQLFQNSPIAIVLLDEQDKIIQINESFTQLFDYYPDEIKGKYINNLIVSPEMKEEAESYSAQVRQGYQFNKESYRRRKDGTLVYVQIVGIPITLKGKIVGMYGMYLDMTQRKEAEDKLNLAKKLAEQSAKMKTEFLAQMSHEIRTPLNVITANVDYLKEEVGEKNEPESRDCFEAIELSSQRIIRTIDLILNMSEIQLGLFIPMLSKVDLDSQVLSKLYVEYKKLALNKGISLVYNCEVKKPEVETDEYCVTQIFSNLIDNAIKFTQKGQVKILVTRNIRGCLIFEVKDTGIGISKEYIPKLFTPFRQEDHGYSRKYEGNGLGLALVKSYCDINNAILEVESEKNVGSTFRVILGNK